MSSHKEAVAEEHGFWGGPEADLVRLTYGTNSSRYSTSFNGFRFGVADAGTVAPCVHTAVQEERELTHPASGL